VEVVCLQVKYVVSVLKGICTFNYVDAASIFAIDNPTHPRRQMAAPHKPVCRQVAKILSAGQKETGKTEIFERRQIIHTPKKPI